MHACNTCTRAHTLAQSNTCTVHNRASFPYTWPIIQLTDMGAEERNSLEYEQGEKHCVPHFNSYCAQSLLQRAPRSTFLYSKDRSERPQLARLFANNACAIYPVSYRNHAKKNTHVATTGSRHFTLDHVAVCSLSFTARAHRSRPARIRMKKSESEYG